MKVAVGTPADIGPWMELVEEISWNFPGLDTPEDLHAHQETVLKFMNRGEALCVRAGRRIAGVLLYSTKHNMLCCLAVSAEYRRRGVASMLLDEALLHLDRARPVTVSTFREDDPKGAAPRALYRKYGFREGRMLTEFGYPNQEFILER